MERRKSTDAGGSDSSGFSRDVCAILLIANITRCFFWLGEGFEFGTVPQQGVGGDNAYPSMPALLVQSILMILSQLLVLYICIKFRPTMTAEALGMSSRPFSFWQWLAFGTYVEFLAALM